MKTTSVVVLVALMAGAVGCDEGDTDPCPQIKAGGGVIRPVVATGSAPAASGGTLLAGTYSLSKLDVVLSASPSPEGKLNCEGLAAATQQVTMRFTPSSATEGTLLSLAVGDDGNGTTTERRSSNSYVLAGSVLTVSAAGNVCETTLVPLADGGLSESRTVDNSESQAQARPYSSSGDTLLLFAPSEAGESPDCVVVYTFTKQ